MQEMIPSSYDALYQPALPPGRSVPSRRAAAAVAPPMPPHAMVLPPHHVAARMAPSGLDAGYGGGYAAKDAVESGAGLAPAYAVPSAVPMLLGDLQELKAHGRTGTNAPELAIIPDFGIITQVGAVWVCRCSKGSDGCDHVIVRRRRFGRRPET